MTKEEKQPPKEPAWAAYVAIDWADRKHVWQMHVAEDGSPERGELEQTPEAIEMWASQLAIRFGGRRKRL